MAVVQNSTMSLKLAVWRGSFLEAEEEASRGAKTFSLVGIGLAEKTTLTRNRIKAKSEMVFIVKVELLFSPRQSNKAFGLKSGLLLNNFNFTPIGPLGQDVGEEAVLKALKQFKCHQPRGFDTLTCKKG